MKLKIPEDYIEFLYWVKERTEKFWSKNPATSEDDFVCEDWAYGAKWIGLSDSEIETIESRYGVKFSPEHRMFLKILHSIDRKEIIEYTETFDEDAEVKIEHIPFFYNWLSDEQEIQNRLNWPYRTIFEDVTGANKVWLESWGQIRPKSDKEKERLFSEWFNQAPRVIPIKGHRFVVNDVKDAPVLSIYGSDIIVYGWNIRHYLLNELKDHLNLLELVYDTRMMNGTQNQLKSCKK